MCRRASIMRWVRNFCHRDCHSLSGLICFLFWVVGGAGVFFSFSFGSDVDWHMRVFLQGVFKAPT